MSDEPQTPPEQTDDQPKRWRPKYKDTVKSKPVPIEPQPNRLT